jgi:hypothetical protein
VKVRDWHSAGGDDDATSRSNDKNLGLTQGERQNLWRCHRVSTRSCENVSRESSTPKSAWHVGQNASGTIELRDCKLIRVGFVKNTSVLE